MTVKRHTRASDLRASATEGAVFTDVAKVVRVSPVDAVGSALLACAIAVGVGGPGFVADRQDRTRC